MSVITLPQQCSFIHSLIHIPLLQHCIHPINNNTAYIRDGGWKSRSLLKAAEKLDWACLKTRLIITEGHRRKASGKENSRKTKNTMLLDALMQEDEESVIDYAKLKEKAHDRETWRQWVITCLWAENTGSGACSMYPCVSIYFCCVFHCNFVLNKPIGYIIKWNDYLGGFMARLERRVFLYLPSLFQQGPLKPSRTKPNELNRANTRTELEPNPKLW